MLEASFKVKAKQEIMKRFPDLDLDFINSGINDRSMPDLFIIGPNFWAALEFKRKKHSSHRPNQDHHIARLNKKGYATFVYPENLEEVLNGLEELFSS